MGDYPRLSGWAVRAIASDLVRERHRELRETHRGKGSVKTEAELGGIRHKSSTTAARNEKV